MYLARYRDCVVGTRVIRESTVYLTQTRNIVCVKMLQSNGPKVMKYAMKWKGKLGIGNVKERKTEKQD